MTGKTVVDPDTSNYWKFWAGGYDGKEVTTQNVGRIWTDKTVKETAANEELGFPDHAVCYLFDIRYDGLRQTARHRAGAGRLLVR